MTEEHMPDCASRRAKPGTAMPTGPLYQPGTCNCELGRLRAEVENLKQQVILADAAKDIAMHGAEAFSAEIVKLRDWQRRILPYLKQWTSVYDPDCLIHKLIAEAEEQPDGDS